MAESNAAFGEILRRSRRTAGLTQEELADRAGLSSRVISDLERGVIRAPRRDTLTLLADALNLSPQERAEWERIRRRTSIRAPVAGPSVETRKSARPVRTNLPLLLDPLIGRERALADIHGLLSSARLVTLTGPGGIGKTRLAIAAGLAALDAFADGVLIVELAPVHDADLVVAAIGRALGTQETSGQPTVWTIESFLRDKHLLLLLDNFEHVLDAAPAVADLLAYAPALHVLVTSRARLGLHGEHEYPVTPLEIPDSSRSTSRQSLAQYPSVALFVQRARQVNPDFDVSNESLASIAGICRRLDGLPLALELAAAKTKIMTPSELLARLDDPLAVLTSGSRHVPDRHQTVRKTLQWSYELLEPDDQRILQRFSAFVGGWTLAAAEVVGGGDDVLDRLASLVDNSLVVKATHRDGQSRFHMLEVVREFALGYLNASGDADDARRCHSDYFLGLAEKLAPELRGDRSVARYGELSVDHENLQTALTYTLAVDPDRALRTAAILEKYWFMRGSFDEWEYWISETLRRSSGASDPDRARALSQLAFLSVHRNDLDRARATAEEALAIASDQHLLEVMGRATSILGLVAQNSGELPGALSLARQAFDLYQQSGADIASATQLGNIALLEQNLGEYDRAVEILKESTAILLDQGELFFASMNLINLGEILRYLGKLDEAGKQLDTAIGLARELGAPQMVASALISRAHVAIDLGNDLDAIQLLDEGLNDGATIMPSDYVLSALEGVAIVASVRGQAHAAVRLFSAVDALRHSTNVVSAPLHQERQSGYLTNCQSALATREWDECWSSGQILSLAKATELAQQQIAQWQTDELDSPMSAETR